MKNWLQGRFAEYLNVCPVSGRLRSIKTPANASRWLFFLLGIASLVWFLIRVIPKPTRALYPCMRVAGPLASGFVTYIVGLVVSAAVFKQALSMRRQARYVAASALVIAGGAVGFVVTLPQEPQPAYANSFHLDSANQPLGAGEGIFPGRVVWVHDPDATNASCTNRLGDGFFLSKNTDMERVQRMVNNALLQLTGETTVGGAWHALFVHFNQARGKGSVGYREGEKIFIKANLVGSSVDAQYRVTNPAQYGMSRTAPQSVLAVLRHLVHEVGVPQERISVGDPMTYVMQEYYELWNAEFPEVLYIDHRGTMGRTRAVPGSSDAIHYSDRGAVLRMGSWADASSGAVVRADRFYTVIEEADYLINIPALKAHARAGVTMAAKNHFGSHTRDDAKHLHMGLVSPDNGTASRSGYGQYRIQVDLMGHRLLGGNTLLYLVDGLWAGSEAVDPPRKFQTPPFNGHWTSSIFASQDPVAIESVGFDFLKAEFAQGNPYATWPQMVGADDYLHQAADPAAWPAGVIYDPENDGVALQSLGVHEHWNNALDKQYARNLGANEGIELVQVTPSTYVSVQRNEELPDRVRLMPAYPNPFNPETRIPYEMREAVRIELAVYDLAGRRVATLFMGARAAGSYVAVWDGRTDSGFDAPSGVYMVRLTNEEAVHSRRLVLVR